MDLANIKRLTIGDTGTNVSLTMRSLIEVSGSSSLRLACNQIISLRAVFAVNDAQTFLPCANLIHRVVDAWPRCRRGVTTASP